MNVPEGAKRIAYGTGPLQFGELRLPAGRGPHPVAVIVHGGCWSAKLGNLDDRAVALDLLRPMAAALTAAGIATWNLEYRRLGNEGGGWHGSFQDVARGADHLRRRLREWAEVVERGASEEEFEVMARREVDDAERATYEAAMPLWQSYAGLKRYWDKRPDAA